MVTYRSVDAQTDYFGSPPKELKAISCPSKQLQRDALGRMLDGAGQLVAVSRIPLSIWLALMFVLSQIWTGVFKVC